MSVRERNLKVKEVKCIATVQNHSPLLQGPKEVSKGDMVMKQGVVREEGEQ